MNTTDLSGKRECKIAVKKALFYRELDSWIDINASIEEVWENLVDFGSWKKWNSFIPLVEGKLEVGTTITIKVISPGMKEMLFKPQIYAITSYKKISWGGSFMIFFYKGVHDFFLEYIEHTITRFRQIETFKGPIVMLMHDMITKTARGYQNMNEEFKDYIEKNIRNS